MLVAKIVCVGQGVFVDGEGFVCEGPAMNIGFILRDGTMVVPPFTKTLAGVTIRRVMSELPKVRFPLRLCWFPVILPPFMFFC